MQGGVLDGGKKTVPSKNKVSDKINGRLVLLLLLIVIPLSVMKAASMKMKH